MPSGSADVLRWNAHEIRKLLARKHIPNRGVLARRLDRAESSICYTFSRDWEGDVSSAIAVAICREFDVALHRIVTDPRFA